MEAAVLVPRTHLQYAVLAFLVALFVLSHRGPGAPGVKELDAAEVQALSAAGALVVDVRELAVSGRAHLPGALLIPLETLVLQLEGRGVAKTADIVVYCADGSTLGPRAAQALQQAGFVSVAHLRGGLEGWRAAGLPVRSL